VNPDAGPSHREAPGPPADAESLRLRSELFERLHEALLITDAQGRVLDANPALCRLLGCSLADVLGTVPEPLSLASSDPHAQARHAAMAQALHQQGHWRGEFAARHAQGHALNLELSLALRPAQPGTAGGHGPGAAWGESGLLMWLRERPASASSASPAALTAGLPATERRAAVDALTGLPNREQLSLLLAQAMASAERHGELLLVCCLDLDHFKLINDRHGPAAGNRLLVELAGRLLGALRHRGHGPDSAARLGGDEFVLLLHAGTLEEARFAVERVLRVVAQPLLLNEAQPPAQVTASMGLTVFPIDRSDADTLLRHADHALYSAKQQGRNGYEFFDPEQRRRTEARAQAIGRIQQALDRHELVLHYQPKVELRQGLVLGFEALLRWAHPSQGLVAPLQFLPIVESTGLSSRIGDWVLAQALEQLGAWRRQGLDLTVSVNVSARHLQEADFAQRLAELLARHPEPLARHLELEMLETAAHADIEATSALVSRCRALGVRFSLDDFGTGYSTLTYLKRLPVDVLKIDRSFVHHMLDDAQDRALVEGVIGLAGTFGCTVVAEGVESARQAQALLELGCSIGQGNGIAAAMPADQVPGWTRAWRGFGLPHQPAHVSAHNPIAP